MTTLPAISNAIILPFAAGTGCSASFGEAKPFLGPIILFVLASFEKRISSTMPELVAPPVGAVAGPLHPMTDPADRAVIRLQKRMAGRAGDGHGGCSPSPGHLGGWTSPTAAGPAIFFTNILIGLLVPLVVLASQTGQTGLSALARQPLDYIGLLVLIVYAGRCVAVFECAQMIRLGSTNFIPFGLKRFHFRSHSRFSDPVLTDKH